MKSTPNKFFTAKEQAEIVGAIRSAEKHTSGEIMVHVTNTSAEFEDEVKQVAAVFKKLELDKTILRNGVLISIAKDDRKVAIWGDEGIHAAVPQGYWQHTIDLMRSEMKQGHYVQGVIKGIHTVGEKLKKYFPKEGDDKNEIKDQVLFE